MEKIQNKTSELLEAMEKIMELGKNSGLSAEFYKKAGRYIRIVSSKLSMTPVRSVLLSFGVRTHFLYRKNRRSHENDYSIYQGCGIKAAGQQTSTARR